jgi:hypothetical protein
MAPPTPNVGSLKTLRVEGLAEIIRDVKLISENLSDELTDEVIHAAKPVGKRTTEIILSPPPEGMRNMDEHWAGMRIGVARAKGEVYVVPAARSRRRRGQARPNVSREFRIRMEKALDEKRDEVADQLEFRLGRLFDRYGF